MHDLDGKIIAYGELQQVAKPDGVVMDDLLFRYKDGSFYEDITKFTEDKDFRLISDQVTRRGPAFKQDTESLVEAKTGNITVRTKENGKEKTTTKHIDVPPDVSNGLLFTLAKNFNPSIPTTLPLVVPSTSPQIVKLNIIPAEEKVFRAGLISRKAQHYVIKVKIEGIKGAIAPLVGKQPQDMDIWVVKSEAPSFLEFEGQLSENSPRCRIELAAPEPEAKK